MDLRGLDPFVFNPPGRTGNLYDTFGVTRNYIDEKNSIHRELPSSTLCKEASTVSNTICFQENIPVTPITPRRMQFDVNVENIINYPQSNEFYIKKRENKSNTLLFLILILIIFFFYFA